MFSLSSFRAQFEQVLHLHESPHRTALAFAIGVFIAFSPHYGFHTVSVFFFAWLFRLNYLAVFLGSLVNNPWTLLPILAGTLYAGFFVLGMPQNSPVNWQTIQMEDLWNSISPYFFPFILGGCLLGLLGALMAYPLMLLFIRRCHAVKNHRS